MGWFRKQKDDYLKMALQSYANNILRYTTDSFETSQYTSWGKGAMSVIGTFTRLGRAAGTSTETMLPNNLNSAKLVLECSIQPMISFWYHVITPKGVSAKKKEEARRISLTNVQTFLGLSSEHRIELYVNLDRELQCFLNGKVKIPARYIDVFCQRYWECITGEQVVDWSKLQFPLKSHQQFIDACHEGKRCDFIDQITFMAGFMTSPTLMLKEFNKLYK